MGRGWRRGLHCLAGVWAGYHHLQSLAEAQLLPSGEEKGGETLMGLGEGQAGGLAGCVQSSPGSGWLWGDCILLWVTSGLASGPPNNTTLTDIQLLELEGTLRPLNEDVKDNRGKISSSKPHS